MNLLEQMLSGLTATICVVLLVRLCLGDARQRRFDHTMRTLGQNLRRGAEQLWRIRHSISEAVQGSGRMVAFDIAVPRSGFAEFREKAVHLVEQAVQGAVVYDFGHLGDGGVHLNVVVPRQASDTSIGTLRDAVYALTVDGFGGSFSAEHGVGPYNHRWYAEYTESAKLELATALHNHFDATRRLGNVRLDNSIQ